MAKNKGNKEEYIPTEGQEEGKVDQIDALLAEKEFKGMHYGSRSGTEIVKPDIITTGSYFLDQALGGGYRASSWSRAFSSPEMGKSSQGLRWARNWQEYWKAKGIRPQVVIWNAEGRITQDLVARSGIDTSKDFFRIIDTNKSDFIYTGIDRLATDNPNKVRYFHMVDSTDACERTVDIQKNIGEAEKIGGGATVLSAAGKRLSLLFSITGHHLYMTSQIREKMTPSGGSKGVSGGQAAKFYSSLTMKIMDHWSDFAILENPSDKKSKEVGRLVQIKLEKTYNESTGKTVLVPVKYGKGLWEEYESMMIAQTWGFLTTKGAHYSWEESFREELKSQGIQVEEKFHGERNLRLHFDENKDLVKFIAQKMKSIE